MAEQLLEVRGPVAPVAEGVDEVADVGAAAPADDGLALQELAGRLASAAPSGRRALAAELAEVLDGVRRGPEAERVAQVVLSMLGDRVFDGLATPAGRPLRAVAVDVLLRLGYPFALEVEPDDLQFLRETQRDERLRPLRRLGLALVLAAAAGVAAWAAVRWALPQAAPGEQPSDPDVGVVDEPLPTEVHSLRALGQTRYDAGDYKGAISPLRECVRRAPDDFGCRTYLGAALVEVGVRASAPELTREGSENFDRAEELLRGRAVGMKDRNVLFMYRPVLGGVPGARPGDPMY